MIIVNLWFRVWTKFHSEKVGQSQTVAELLCPANLKNKQADKSKYSTSCLLTSP